MTESDDRTAEPSEDGLEERQANDEEAVSTLLHKAYDPPKMSEVGRHRVLGVLKERQRANADESKRRDRFRLRAVLSGLAAAACLALVVWWQAAPGVVTIANDGLGPERRILRDGSVAVLDAGAELLEHGERDIELVRGRAFFDVKPDDTAFVVETKLGVARALGTAFEVREEADTLMAAVVRGKVELEGKEGATIVRVGEIGELRGDAAPVRRAAPRLSHRLQWARSALEQAQSEEANPRRIGNLLAREPRSGTEWPLPMRKLVVDVHIQDDMARTTLDQTFVNAANRQLEGVYAFPLPSGAAISRLAMYVDGKRMEGGIVERQRGRDVYESIVHRRRDPALLEWMSGNQYRIRIFPIAARREKRLFLSYTQDMSSTASDSSLTVPLPTLDRAVDEVEFRIVIAGGADNQSLELISTSHALDVKRDGEDLVATFEAKRSTLGDDLRLTLKRDREPIEVARYLDDDHEFVRADITPAWPGLSIDQPNASYVVMIDTSASRSAADRRAAASLVRALHAEADDEDRIAVVAFDSTVRTFEGGLRSVRAVPASKLNQWLEQETLDGVGVTDMAQAFAESAKLMSGAPDGPRYLVYVGDAVATEGAQEPAALRESIAGLGTFVGVAIGDGVDTRLMTDWAGATGGYVTELRPAESIRWQAFDLLSALRVPRLVDVEVELLDKDKRELPSAKAYVAPVVAAGDPVRIVGRSPRSTEIAAVRISGQLAGEKWSEEIELPRGDAEAGYLPRTWAQRHIDALLLDDASTHEGEITNLALENFLVTPFTSLLVLENDAMYEQFRVTRSSEEGWASYKSPEKIDVVTLPSSVDTSALPSFAVVYPKPLSLVLASGMGGRGFGSGHGRLGGSFRGEGIGLGSIGTIGHGAGGGLGLSGIGFGGGGKGDTLDLRNATVSLGPVQQLAAADGDLAGRKKSAKISAFPDLPRPMEEEKFRRDNIGEDDFKRQTFLPVAEQMATKEEAAFKQPFAASPLSLVSGKRLRSDRSYSGDAMGLHWYSTLGGAGDARLDDIVELVPGYAASTVDETREWVVAASLLGEPQSKPDDATAELWRTALAAVPIGTWVREDGTKLSTQGGVTLELTAPPHSWIALRPKTLTTYVPELGLDIERTSTGTSPVWRVEHAPFSLPEEEELGVAWNVASSRTGDGQTLTFELARPRGGEAVVTVRYELDENKRVARAIRELDGQRDIDVRVAYDADNIVLRTGGATVQLKREPRAIELPKAATTKLVLPLRAPTYYEELADKSPSRELLVQWIASLKAVGEVVRVAGRVNEITAEYGDLRRGELALVGSALWQYGDERRAEILESVEDPGPWTSYFAAMGKLRSDSDAVDALSGLLDRPDLAGALARARRANQLVLSDRSVEGLAAVVKKPAPAELTLSVMLHASSYAGYEHAEELEKLWLVVAKQQPELGIIAHFQAAELAQRQGYNNARVGAYTLSAFQQAARLGTYPIVTSNHRYRINGGRSDGVAFDAFWFGWRTRLMQSPDPQAKLSLLVSMQQLGREREMATVVTALAKEPVDDPNVAVDIATQLLSLGEHEATIKLLAPYIESDRPELLDILSSAHERAGNTKLAAGLFDRAFEAAPEELPLDSVRTAFSRRFELEVARVRADDPEADPLAVARRFRRIDPGSLTIDMRVAAYLSEIGDKQGAWRHLSSIVERDPGEGSAHAAVAEQLLQLGDLERALSQWKRAADVEPTNPQWAIRRAGILVGLQRYDDAEKILSRVVAGTYQDRFSGDIRGAEQMLESLKEVPR